MLFGKKISPKCIIFSLSVKLFYLIIIPQQLYTPPVQQHKILSEHTKTHKKFYINTQKPHEDKTQCLMLQNTICFIH